MASLLGLSHELLHCVFIEITPMDLSALSRTCRDLNSYISGNRLLHKDIYVRRYDPPMQEPEADWEKKVHDLIKLETMLDSADRYTKRDSLEFVAKNVDYLLRTSASDPDASLNIRFLSERFADSANIDALLCSSTLFGRARGDTQSSARTAELRQMSAKLHCMYGVPIDEIPPNSDFSNWRRDSHLSPSARTRLQTKPKLTHTYARSKVYDLSQYDFASLWGPFQNDWSQRVDWEKVEAIMIVLGFNLRKFTERSDGRFPMIWDEPFVGATPRSFISPPVPAATERKNDFEGLDEKAMKIRELRLSLDAQDPYGVTGTWMRVVCFLDYNDLHAFNFTDPVPTSGMRPPIDTEEAIRLIRIKWRVTKIEPAGALPIDDDGDDEADGDLDWSNFQGERLPVVHFVGTSRSLHASWDPNANSKIRERGTVRQTPEGQIRWTTFSIFHGEERWRSEGVQIGGVRSARGVLGNWFDKDYDEHGPAGPTAFWKESDELDEEKITRDGF